MSDSGPDERSDTDLVAAGRAGDRNALEALLRRHQPRLYALCRRLTGDPDDAEDACQEALVKIVRRLDSFDGRSAFSTWAYRLTTNACLDELRRHRRQPEPGLPEEAGGDSTTPLGRATRSRPLGPAAESGADERVVTRLEVDAALATLPAEFRAAVVLRDLCDLSYGEIAVALEIPPGTVRSRIARARAALVPLLTDEQGGNKPTPSDRQTL